MKQTQIPEPVMLDVDSIKVFVGRTREIEGFEALKRSIESVGLKMPIQVRDISERPASERKREGGGLYRYELIAGQGRLTAFQELGRKKIPALVMDVKEVEVVGRFLAENIIREPLPWAVKAKLVQSELDAGRTHEEIAESLSITPKHVAKFERILSKTKLGLEDEVLKMPMNAAEVFTTLPESDQAIVVQVLQETGEKEIQAVVKKAREVKEKDGELSPMALKKSILRVDEDLKRLRERLKITRLHASIGPANLELLLDDPKFRRAAEKAEVPIKKFLSTVSK